VKLWVPDTTGMKSAPQRQADAGTSPTACGRDPGAGRGRTVTVPMQGTIIQVLVSEGDIVEANQTSVCWRP